MELASIKFDSVCMCVCAYNQNKIKGKTKKKQFPKEWRLTLINGILSNYLAKIGRETVVPIGNSSFYTKLNVYLQR